MKRRSSNDYPLMAFCGIIFFLLYIFQYTDNIIGSGSGTFPQLMLGASLFSGMFFGDKYGAIFGFFLGTFVDAVSAETLCYNGIMMMLIGYFGGVAVQRLINNNFRSAILLIFISATIYYFGIWSIMHFSVVRLKTEIFRSLFLTVLFSLPIYALLHFAVKLRKKQLIKRG